MKIDSVFVPEFGRYGRIVEGMDDMVSQLVTALNATPLPDGVQYVPEDPILQELPAAKEVSEYLYGGMPVQLGWCNGHNNKLNCLEYHRDSEFNLGTSDFVLLLARQTEIADGILDTGMVKAFWVPAGVMVEIYSTTLHYAPCHCDPEKGFRVLVALPKGTNLDRPAIPPKSWEDQLLWARNKWLMAHPESPEAAQGAYVALVGENISISNQI